METMRGRGGTGAYLGAEVKPAQRGELADLMGELEEEVARQAKRCQLVLLDHSSPSLSPSPLLLPPLFPSCPRGEGRGRGCPPGWATSNRPALDSPYDPVCLTHILSNIASDCPPG